MLTVRILRFRIMVVSQRTHNSSQPFTQGYFVGKGEKNQTSKCLITGLPYFPDINSFQYLNRCIPNLSINLADGGNRNHAAFGLFRRRRGRVSCRGDLGPPRLPGRLGTTWDRVRGEGGGGNAGIKCGNYVLPSL